MTLIGALAAAASVAALVISLRRPSRVRRWLARVAPDPRGAVPWYPLPARDLADAGLGMSADRLLAAKVVAGLACALAGAMLALAIPIGPLVVVACAYGGFIAPSLAIEARAGRRRCEAEAAVATLVEWLEALVAAGRPPETALAALARRPTGAELLDRVLRRTADAYALGAPLFRTLADQGRAAGLGACVALAQDLERSRDMGQASLAAIRLRRDSSRAAERARSLDAASRVEGKLMLVLVLCYMPALMLLVVVPLFLSLLEGLFV